MKNKITHAFASLLMLFSISICFAQQDGSVDMAFNPEDVGGVNRLLGTVNEIIEQSDGKVLVVGLISQYSGHAVHNIIRLNNDETFDSTFNPGSGANEVINNIVELPDSKLLIAGAFTSYNGTSCNSVARLNSDGSIDTAFNISGLPSGTYVIKSEVATDGKIVVATRLNNYTYKVLRLNSDGTLDTNFSQNAISDYQINDMTVQTDGKVIVSGYFTSFSGTNADGLVRLNTDGTVDTGFNLNFPVQYNVQSFALSDNGKITVLFTDDSGNILLRYNVDGSLDTDFTAPDDIQYQYATGLVTYIDNKLWITHQGVLKRLSDNGSYDTTFTSPDTVMLSYKLTGVGLNGKIYITGGFVSVNDELDNGLARLNTDGTRDSSFNIGGSVTTGADERVIKILKQDDNKLIIAGSFMSYNGVLSKNLARLNSDGTLDSSFVLDEQLGAGYSLLSLYPGGKVLIASGSSLIRLNADGSIDTTFNAEAFVLSNESGGVGDAVVLADGKVIIAGGFVAYGTVAVPNICRLNVDGSLDTTFSSSIFEGISGLLTVRFVDRPAEQKIIVGTIGAESALYKIDYNGIEDASFNHVPQSTMFWVDALAVESDGTILVAGYGDGTIYYNQKLIRFNANGTINQILIDRAFSGAQAVAHIVPAAGNKFYITALSEYYVPLTGVSLVRYNYDGTLDDSFELGFTSTYLSGFVFQGNSIVVGGKFSNYNGVDKNSILRLNSSGAMATTQQTAKTQTVFAYKNNDALQVESVGQAIKEVKVYDMAGRLLSDTKNVNALSTTVTDVLHSRILIVNVKLEDDTVVSKKIYY